MIFEEIKETKNTEECFKAIALGIVDYKRKILNFLNGGSIPDTELPFILAALKLVTEDIEAIINRKDPEEKERMYGCCEDACEMCRFAISTVTVQKKAKGD